jgi:ParB-like chromosome segregation protein Spo0J
MQIKEAKIFELRPAEYNPHKKSEHILKTVRQSIKEYGFLQPVVINTHQCERCGDRRNIIVGGHRRIEAAQAEGLTEVPAVFVNLHIEDEKRANLRLNAQEKFDTRSLADLLTELHNLDATKISTLGFDANEIVRLLFEARYTGNKLSGILQDKFLIPPFSVFDAKQGYWQRRKKQWLDLLGDLAETRETKLAGSENNLLMRGINSGVSIFDPVVSEVIFLWFVPEKGRILDPFAGSLARGGVAAALGFDYTGVEIRKEQIEINEKKTCGIGIKSPLHSRRCKRP